MDIIEYDKMIERALSFYEKLNIEVSSDKDINRAVKSLTMPQYAKEYNDLHKDRHENKIGDHCALSTVGDAVCEAFLMLNRYEDNKTSGDLTDCKELLTNDRLNEIGQKMLSGFLFERNNDLNLKNTKAFATAFEAVIGFIALLDKENGTKNANEILKKYLS